MHHRYPQAVHATFQQGVEDIEVDADEGIRTPRGDLITETPQPDVELRQAQERIPQAVHLQTAEIDRRPEPAGHHLRPPDTAKLGLRPGGA